jgi:hypothetical protein
MSRPTTASIVEEWQKVHRALMEEEQRLVEMGSLPSSGEDALKEQRDKVACLHVLAEAVLSKALKAQRLALRQANSHRRRTG